jgi:hypothetical protein
VARCWARGWAELNGIVPPLRLPEPAAAVLRALSFHRAAGRNPAPHWFTTLLDPPREGVVRDEVRDIIADLSRHFGDIMDVPQMIPQISFAKYTLYPFKSFSKVRSMFATL